MDEAEGMVVTKRVMVPRTPARGGGLRDIVEVRGREDG